MTSSPVWLWRIELNRAPVVAGGVDQQLNLLLAQRDRVDVLKQSAVEVQDPGTERAGRLRAGQVQQLAQLGQKQLIVGALFAARVLPALDKCINDC